MKVEKLTEDFSDGTRLIALLELLTGIKLTKKYNKAPKSRVHYIENCHLALMLLKESKKMQKGFSMGAEGSFAHFASLRGFLYESNLLQSHYIFSVPPFGLFCFELLLAQFGSNFISPCVVRRPHRHHKGIRSEFCVSF